MGLEVKRPQRKCVKKQNTRDVEEKAKDREQVIGEKTRLTENSKPGSNTDRKRQWERGSGSLNSCEISVDICFLLWDDYHG